MNENILNTILMAFGYLLLFASAEFMYYRFKLHAEITRKYVHAVSGFTTLLFPVIIVNHWLVMSLSASFLLLLYVSKKFNQLQSIHAVDRPTHGSTLFPIVVYGCFWVSTKLHSDLFFYVPILILAICDPIAALLGKKAKLYKYQTFGYVKSFIGSAGFFVTAWVLSFMMLWNLGYSHTAVMLVSFTIATITTVAEALTHKGYDNFTIPASAVLTLLIFELI